SDEIYLLSGADTNVKVRDGLMDIKVLREVNDEGLQRWEPVMKEGFPLETDDVARVFEMLEVPTPDLGRDAYTFEDLLSDIVEPHPAITVVHVEKHRTRYDVGGCAAEITAVRANGRATPTIPKQSPDASAVAAAVRAAGLTGWRDTSYPRGLRALVEGEPERYAVIDVGTNSVKFAIAEVDDAGASRRVVDRSEVTRLGEGMGEDGRIGEEPLER